MNCSFSPDQRLSQRALCSESLKTAVLCGTADHKTVSSAIVCKLLGITVK